MQQVEVKKPGKQQEGQREKRTGTEHKEREEQYQQDQEAW